MNKMSSFGIDRKKQAHSSAVITARADASSARDLTPTVSPTENTPALTHPGTQRTFSGLSHPSIAPYKVYKRRFFGLIQLILLNIIVSWDWLSYAPVSSTSAAYFDVPERSINWLSTVFLFAFCAAAPLTMLVLKKHGAKASIAVSSVLILAGNWIRYGGTRSRNFGTVMFGQILIGLAQPFVLNAPTAYSNEWFSEQGRVSATAIASLANPFGGALGQLINPFWADKPSQIPDMILYITLISTIASIPSFFIPKKPPSPPSATAYQSLVIGLRKEITTLLHSVEFWLIVWPYWIFVGLFNSVSSLLNQIYEPYGYSEADAGIAGALLIVVGLISAAISSPLIDRYKFYVAYIKTACPVVALAYLLLIWTPTVGGLAFPYVICSILGAACFGLVPVALEFLVEIHHPLGPAVGSTACWTGGQLLGGIFIILSSHGLQDGKAARPPNNLHRYLIFQSVIAMAVVPLPLCLGFFGRKSHVRPKRFEAEKRENGGIILDDSDDDHRINTT